MDALRKAGDSLRRAHRRDGAQRAGRPGRAAVRQARRRHRLRDDGHQRGQGRRDRRRLRARRAARQRARRRADARRAFAATTPAACSAASRPGRTSRSRSRSSRPARSARRARSIDRAGQPTTVETFGRHDPCVGIRATPIAEAMLALVLMDHALRHRAQCGDVAVADAADSRARALSAGAVADAPPRRTLLAFGAVSFAYFAYSGLFRTYAPLWFQSLGYSTLAIGALASVQSATRVFAPVCLGLARRPQRPARARCCASPSALSLCCALGFLVARRLRAGSTVVTACALRLHRRRDPDQRGGARAPRQPRRHARRRPLRPGARLGLGRLHRRRQRQRLRAADASASTRFPLLLHRAARAAARRGAAPAGARRGAARASRHRPARSRCCASRWSPGSSPASSSPCWRTPASTRSSRSTSTRSATARARSACSGRSASSSRSPGSGSRAAGSARCSMHGWLIAGRRSRRRCASPRSPRSAPMPWLLVLSQVLHALTFAAQHTACIARHQPPLPGPAARPRPGALHRARLRHFRA